NEPAFSLGWSLGDPLIAAFEATGDWAFRLEGLATGSTGLVLSVLHEGHADFSTPAIPVVSSPTSNAGGQPLVARLAVANAPNPFNPSTTISFRLAEAGATTVRVHDVAGRLVRTLLASEERAAGEHAVVWDGRDADGRAVESGIYLCRVESGSSRELRKMTLLK
ncbi:T9SS type A sorting domain-containing protein, partial [bacterium]|nr:T9SS type A sorting domain-containing protein [bacterium]